MGNRRFYVKQGKEDERSTPFRRSRIVGDRLNRRRWSSAPNGAAGRIRLEQGAGVAVERRWEDAAGRSPQGGGLEGRRWLDEGRRSAERQAGRSGRSAAAVTFQTRNGIQQGLQQGTKVPEARGCREVIIQGWTTAGRSRGSPERLQSAGGLQGRGGRRCRGSSGGRRLPAGEQQAGLVPDAAKSSEVDSGGWTMAGGRCSKQGQQVGRRQPGEGVRRQQGGSRR